MLLIYRIRGLQSKPISLLGLSAVRILSQRDKNHISRCWKIPQKNQMNPHPNLNLTKKFYCIPTRIQFMGAFWKTRFPYCSSQPYGYFRYPLYVLFWHEFVIYFGQLQFKLITNPHKKSKKIERLKFQEVFCLKYLYFSRNYLYFKEEFVCFYFNSLFNKPYFDFYHYSQLDDLP